MNIGYINKENTSLFFSHLAALASNGDDTDVPKSVEDARSNGHGHGHSHNNHTAKGEKSVKKNSGSQMNMRGVFLHVMADALGSVVVIISALIMWLTEWEYKVYVDPGEYTAMDIRLRTVT